MPEQRKGELDEIVTRAGFFQQGAEQHKEKDHRGRDAKRDPEDPF